MAKCNKSGECVNPIKYKCCHWCIKLLPIENKELLARRHWLPESGCDLGEDRPQMCKEYRCEWARAADGE